MIIVFVSECEKKAFKYSRRVLNKYAQQLGRRTWLARLSEQALQQIYAELRSKASRQMSVSCHRVQGRQQTKLVWIVGTRKHFNDEGYFAFSWTKTDNLHNVPEPTPLERGQRYLTELAGLFHDLGKSTAAFQNKLFGKGINYEPLRHDYVSVLMLQQWLGSPASDVEWLERLSRRNELLPDIERCFSVGHYQYTHQEMRDGLARLVFDDDPESKRDLKPFATTNTSAWFSQLLWLVLSHHRLPKGKMSRKKIPNLSIKNHINRNNSHKQFTNEELDACLQAAGGKQAIWRENTWWTEQVSQKAKQLLTLLKEHPDLASMNEHHYLAYYSRTMLMLGDHYVSKCNTQQTYRGTQSAQQLNFANTIKTPRGNLPAATLNEHLRGVGRESGRLFRVALNLGESLPHIKPAALPAILTTINKHNETPFRWQDDACLKIRKKHNDGIRESGFFGIVIARTGAGKTQACAKIMTQLSEQLRYNLALGLRTLTLQSGTAYQQELELKSHQMSTLVGSELARKLHVLNQKEANATGSSSADDDGFEVYSIYGDDDVDQLLPKTLEALLEHEPKKRLLLSTPILVSTVDYLTAAASPLRSRHLYATLRLMSSDLVLDEVDAYGEEDLIVLGKLIYLSGFFGRKVLLASATLPPAIAAHFFKAYQTGYQRFCQRKGQTEKCFVGWFTDLPEATQVKACNDLSRFQKYHRTVIDKVTDQLRNEIPKRKAQLLSIPEITKNRDGWNFDALFDVVFDRACQLHKAQHVIDFVTRKRVSIGLVRWNNTQPCWRFAQYLLNEALSDEVDHHAICYHAKLLPLVRFTLERELDKLLKRKDEQSFLSHPLIREAIANSPKQDVCIIMSATPIEEVGRDHDFDWAILEPSSTRSIVQSTGRVRRHRPATDNAENIALMSTTVRGARKAQQAYCFGGVETSHVLQKHDYKLQQHECESVYDIELLKNRINACLLLDPEQAEASPITLLEHQKLDDWLSGDALKKRLGLSDFVNTTEFALSDYHHSKIRFRRSYRNLLYWIDEHGDWQRRYDDELKDSYSSGELVKSHKVKLQRSLFSVDVDMIYEELKQQLYPDSQLSETVIRQQLLGIESACYSQDDDSHILHFHSLLGAYR